MSKSRKHIWKGENWRSNENNTCHGNGGSGRTRGARNPRQMSGQQVRAALLAAEVGESVARDKFISFEHAASS